VSRGVSLIASLPRRLPSLRLPRPAGPGKALDRARPPAAALARGVRRRTSWISGNGWLAIAGAVVGILAGQHEGWTELRVLGLTCAIALALALLWTLGRSAFEVTFELHQPRVTVGDTASGRVELQNKARRLVFPTRIELAVGQGRAHFMLPALGHEESHEQLFDVPTRRRSVIRIGPVSSVRTDPLHLLRRRRDWSESVDLYVHPVTVALASESLGFVRDIEGVTTQDLSSNDVSFHALREYLPGDDRRAIHWRTTARVGKLMVRQFEETRRAHLLIVLPTALADYASEDDFESAISITGSLARHALREEREVSIYTSSGQLVFASGPLMLDRLAEIEPAEVTLSLRDLAARASSAVPHASVCTILAGRDADPRDLRSAHKSLPLSVSTIALRVGSDLVLGRRKVGDLPVVDLPDVHSLARAMRSVG
jgi:uncharacterized protein (DUF58 family)